MRCHFIWPDLPAVCCLFCLTIWWDSQIVFSFFLFKPLMMMKRFLKWTWDILNKDIWWQQTPMILSTFGCQDSPNQKKKKLQWLYSVSQKKSDGAGPWRGTVEHKIEQSGGCNLGVQETPKSGTPCYLSPLDVNWEEWPWATGVDFPWRLSGKEPTCLFRRPGLDPWSEEIPHVSEQQSPVLHTDWVSLLWSPRAETTEARMS